MAIKAWTVTGENLILFKNFSIMTGDKILIL